jgi:hypothetical protein
MLISRDRFGLLERKRRDREGSTWCSGEGVGDLEGRWVTVGDRAAQHPATLVEDRRIKRYKMQIHLWCS